MNLPRFFLLCLGSFPALLAGASTGNNLLLIIADDFGVDSCPLYNSTATGASLPPAPTIESLAATGVRFTSAYANPVCSPTRACLLTGRLGFRTGVGQVVSVASGNSLTASEFTLPEAFAANAAAGYQLASFGKWHLTAGPNSNLTPSTIGGWPYFAGYLGGELASYSSWTKLITNGLPAGTSSTPGVTTYPTTDTVNDALAWITAQNNANKPWFAWVAFAAPHTPFHKPPSALCPHYAGLSGTANDINANKRAYYEAAVEALDTEMARLIAGVDRAKTNIIFLGDNGPPGQVLQPPYPSGHGKDSLYEGGTHIPLIINGPSVVSPGRTSDAPVHVTDLYPTLIELAGLSLATTVPSSTVLDGQSLKPVLSNGSFSRTKLYTESFDLTQPTADGRALRDDRFKLIRNNSGTDELYDLLTDPYETTNLLNAALSTEASFRKNRLTYWMAGYSAATAPAASIAATSSSSSITVTNTVGASYTLWRCSDLATAAWAPVAGATVVTVNAKTTLTDPAPPAGSVFYSVVVSVP